MSLSRFFTYSLLLLLFLVGCEKRIDKLVTHADEARAINEDESFGKFALKKPNIILIIGDDYGYELPDFTGGESYNTPNLNYMVKNGIHFTQAFSHPDGFPSRLALYTGKYNFRNYVTWGYLPAGEKTIANLLKEEAGYKTCFVGKWQCDGGDTRIKSAGYDAYSVFLPFAEGSDQREGRYKDPTIYENGGYLPESETDGKYSEDFFTKYFLNFIDQNYTSNFFAVYAHNLVGSEFSPTPDDPDFSSWNPNNPEDKKYFSGMVAYQDKIVGKILAKLRQKKIDRNTCIIFIGDNGTSKKIKSLYNGVEVNGGKNLTSRTGTITPMIFYWPIINEYNTSRTRKTLVDFTDMMPSLADLAKVKIPSSYGQIDGISFIDDVIMYPNKIKDRSWVFTHWDNRPDDDAYPLHRYINNARYKLYDSTMDHDDNFYNIELNSKETIPLKDSELTAEEMQIKASFKAAMDSLKLD